jgi:hypothetical protein
VRIRSRSSGWFMELSALLNAGAIAAIIANAFNSLILLIAARLRTPQSLPSAQDQLLMLLLNLMAGIGLGLLFWLSWGLTAIVAVPWWQRGAVFALIVWGVLCVPSLIQVALMRETRWRAVLSTAAQWLTTCATVGLACAWSWQNGN